MMPCGIKYQGDLYMSEFEKAILGKWDSLVNKLEKLYTTLNGEKEKSSEETKNDSSNYEQAVVEKWDCLLAVVDKFQSAIEELQ